VWRLTGKIAILCKDNELAVLSSEALRRLSPNLAAEPVFPKLEFIADKDNLRSWTEGRAECLRLFRLAKAGNGAAMGQLGYFYAQGVGGLPRDDVEALRWYRKGADAGDGMSMCGIGFMQKQGQAGLTRDESEAARWFQKGADAGNGLAMSFLA